LTERAASAPPEAVAARLVGDCDPVDCVSGLGLPSSTAMQKRIVVRAKLLQRIAIESRHDAAASQLDWPISIKCGVLFKRDEASAQIVLLRHRSAPSFGCRDDGATVSPRAP
jgi:hypothetical protein